MHWSKLFIPTLRDDHPLLERAGYVRQLSGGIYSYLFLAQRSLLKITAIVREEMNAIGAQEFHLPAAKIRPEEAMVSIARGLLRSY
jgi:prolyl-tRNA synthetase